MGYDLGLRLYMESEWSEITVHQTIKKIKVQTKAQ